MPIKEKDQPGRAKPNESENQPQFASEDEVPATPPERRADGGHPDQNREDAERKAPGRDQPPRGRS
jgi:hypothetical protein